MTALTAVALVAGCTTTSADDPADSAKEPRKQSDAMKGLPEGRPVPYSSLAVGMCSNDDGAVTAADKVGVVDCTTPHRLEILAKVRIPEAANAPFPGQNPLVKTLTKLCDPALEPVLAAAPPGGRIGMQLLPFDKESWESGNRTGYCAVTFPEPATGSVRK
ncbi:septum formation family protein [Streptomyces sp. NPDC058953]|uniref:septum formation family protein n=1 Tax=unclassified Streptomyces TaxID=2593676 RepID=UPI00369A3234